MKVSRTLRISEEDDRKLDLLGKLYGKSKSEVASGLLHRHLEMSEESITNAIDVLEAKRMELISEG